MSPSYGDMLKSLQKSFCIAPAVQVRLAGIVFLPPDNPFARKECVPLLGRWHGRRGTRLDLFEPGYAVSHSRRSTRVEDDGEAPAGYALLEEGKPWLFSRMRFHEFCFDLERSARGAYGGGCQVLIANAFAGLYEARIAYSSAVGLDLEELCSQGALENGGVLLDRLWNFTEQRSFDDPSWGFAACASHSGRPALWHLIRSLLGSGDDRVDAALRCVGRSWAPS
jgi:hypothetical protein